MMPSVDREFCHRFFLSRKVCEIKKHLKRLSNRISTCSVEMMECQDCLQDVGVQGCSSTASSCSLGMLPLPSPGSRSTWLM